MLKLTTPLYACMVYGKFAWMADPGKSALCKQKQLCCAMLLLQNTLHNTTHRGTNMEANKGPLWATSGDRAFMKLHLKTAIEDVFAWKWLFAQVASTHMQACLLCTCLQSCQPLSRTFLVAAHTAYAITTQGPAQAEFSDSWICQCFQRPCWNAQSSLLMKAS